MDKIAAKKLTKSQKTRAAQIREEIEFIERTLKGKGSPWPSVETEDGKRYWGGHYLILIAEYAGIYKSQLEAGQDIWDF